MENVFFFFFCKRDSLSPCPFGRLELKAPDGQIERTPTNRWQKAFRVINVVQTTQKNPSDIRFHFKDSHFQLRSNYLVVFPPFPSLLFFPFLLSSLLRTRAGAKRGIISVSSFSPPRSPCFSVYSLPSAGPLRTVMHSTKLYKRIGKEL